MAAGWPSAARARWEPWLLGAAIGLWVGGFDVLYACQDYAFDREHGLRSIPVRFGITRSLVISRAMHVATIVCMALLAVVVPLGADLSRRRGDSSRSLLLTSSRWSSSTDLSQVKRAFDLNGYVGILYFAMTAAAVYAG